MHFKEYNYTAYRYWQCKQVTAKIYVLHTFYFFHLLFRTGDFPKWFLTTFSYQGPYIAGLQQEI